MQNRITINPESWPRCARCDMPVDSFFVLDEGHSIVMVAKCHGDTETVKVSEELLLVDCNPDTIEFGPAFATQEVL